ncbi:MAG: hypothetical protein QW648_03440 [Nanoarchaeales archaeon]
MKIEINQIEKFLNFVCSGYEKEIFWEIRIFQKNKIYSQKFFKRKEEIISYLKREIENLKDKDCYIGLLPRTKEIGTKDSIKFGNTFVIDLDSEKAIFDYEIIKNSLFSLNFPASLIVNSGNGLHIYYKINKIVEIEKWSIFQNALINFFLEKFENYNIDRVVKDEARIIRIAGTINNKKEPKETKILSEGNIYDFDYFSDFLKNFLKLENIKQESKKIGGKVGRFEVMALLQAARYYLLKGDLDKAKSFGLNRAIFYAWAKYYGPQYKFRSKRQLFKNLIFESKEESEEKYEEWEIVGNEKAPIDRRTKFFIIGNKVQLPKDFDINIARKFERIDSFEKIWNFTIEYLKKFDRNILEDQQNFFEKIYKPIRDNFDNFYKNEIKKDRKNILEYFKN